MSEIEYNNPNCQEFFIVLKVDLGRGIKVRLDSLSAKAKECASIFNRNGDEYLDKNELWEFLDTFHKADMGGGEVNGKLSDKEIDNSLNNYNSQFKKYGVEQKKQMLVEVYSKVLAQEIKAQIDGPSIYQRTIERLKKIGANNILEVLKEYDRISPNETLASAIDNELGLDIKTVREYICKPLVARAKAVGLTNITNFDAINDINVMNTKIKELINKINNHKTAKTTNATSTYKSPYNKIISVKSQVNGISDFTYNRASIEDHVINNATDKQGRKITYFSQIPTIRAKSPQARTDSEKNLLKEFDNYMEYVCKAGAEYGVDPKQIVAITQQEVGCKGLNTLADGKKNNVTSGNGKGYMQITSVCVVDVMGGQGGSISKARFSEKIISRSNNKDFEKLLISRGFKPNCPIEERKAEAEKIWNHIISNKDPEFNIRFGTLWLRYQLQKTSGNFRKAAINYNGSGTRYQYGDSVYNFYNQLRLNQKNYKA